MVSLVVICIGQCHQVNTNDTVIEFLLDQITGPHFTKHIYQTKPAFFCKDQYCA